MLNNIITDLKNLEGQLVGKGSYFEHVYTNEAPIDAISTIDVLENLKPYEVDGQIVYQGSGRNYDRGGLEDFKHFLNESGMFTYAEGK